MPILFHIWKELRKMNVNVEHLQASVAKLNGDVDRLLQVQADTKAKVEDLSAQLAAAQDPAAVAAVQKALDDLAAALDAEDVKVSAAAPEAPQA